MSSTLDIQADLKKGNYFNHGDRYFVTFKYGSDEQKRKIYEAFTKGLIPGYGSNSNRAKDGKEYIMPYFVDKYGKMTAADTGEIGGTSIPKDLLSEFVRRFVERDGMNIKIGSENLSGKFDQNKFDNILVDLNKQQLISKIKTAIDEGKELDAKIAEKRKIKKDDRGER